MCTLIVLFGGEWDEGYVLRCRGVELKPLRSGWGMFDESLLRKFTDKSLMGDIGW